MKKVASYLWGRWRRAARVLGRAQTLALLAVLYARLLSPLGLLMRLGGWDPLDVSARKAARTTNWKPVARPAPDREALRRQS